AHATGDGLTRDAVLHGDPLCATLRAHQTVDEVHGGDVAHPGVADVVQRDEVPVVVLVRVILLGGVVGAVHVAVVLGAHGRIELGHAAQVFHSHVLDAGGVLVLQDFSAAPLF